MPDRPEKTLEELMEELREQLIQKGQWPAPEAKEEAVGRIPSSDAGIKPQ